MIFGVQNGVGYTRGSGPDPNMSVPCAPYMEILVFGGVDLEVFFLVYCWYLDCLWAVSGRL